MFGKWTFRIVSELNMTMAWEGDVGRYQYERSEGVKNEGWKRCTKGEHPLCTVVSGSASQNEHVLLCRPALGVYVDG